MMITLSKELAPAPLARKVCHGPLAEPYRALVHRLRSVGELSASPLKTIGVTSSGHGAGVSTVASNLALAAAEVSDRPVLLLDLNAGCPSAVAPLRASGDLGLRDALTRALPPAECVRETAVSNLSVLAGDGELNGDSLCVDRSRIRDLLRALEHDFGLIVVDLPPANESSLCFATAGLLDGVLIVAEAEHMRSDAAHETTQQLAHAQAKVLGIVLNKCEQHVPNWLYERL